MSMEGKRKWDLKSVFLWKWKKKESNKRNQLGGLLVCMLCATLCGSLRAFFFMSCFPLFPCNLAGPVVSISSGGNSYILLVFVLSLQLAAHRSCLLFFYTEKKKLYIYRYDLKLQDVSIDSSFTWNKKKMPFCSFGIDLILFLF